MVKKILIGVVAALALCVVGILIAASTQPEDFTVKRSTEIKAPAVKAHALVADLHAWDKWSPREKLDPAMKKTFSGAASGVGAVYEWTGNKDVGKGRMTITAVDPGKNVKIKLEFLEPWTATSDTEFTFAEAGETTKVEWTMSGKNTGVMAKTMSMMMNMDAMIGTDFEKGLAALKALAEKSI